MVVGDANGEVTFCVHESCDEKKCGRKKEETILTYLRKLFVKILSKTKKLDAEVDKQKAEEGIEKIRLPENMSRSQFVESYLDIKERKKSQRVTTFKNI